MVFKMPFLYLPKGEGTLGGIHINRPCLVSPSLPPLACHVCPHLSTLYQMQSKKCSDLTISWDLFPNEDTGWSCRIYIKSEYVSLVHVLLQSSSQEPRRVEGKLFSLPYKVAFSKKVSSLPLIPQSHWGTLFISEKVILFTHERRHTQVLQSPGSHFSGFSIAVVLCGVSVVPRRHLAMSGHFWVVTTGRVLLTSRGERPEMLLRHPTVDSTAAPNKELLTHKCKPCQG